MVHIDPMKIMHAVLITERLFRSSDHKADYLDYSIRNTEMTEQGSHLMHKQHDRVIIYAFDAVNNRKFS